MFCFVPWSRACMLPFIYSVCVEYLQKRAAKEKLPLILKWRMQSPGQLCSATSVSWGFTHRLTQVKCVKTMALALWRVDQCGLLWTSVDFWSWVGCSGWWHPYLSLHRLSAHLYTGGRGGSVSRASASRSNGFHDTRFKPRQEQHKKKLWVVPSQKCCADSLSVCPTPVCICTYKNDHVRTLKIL